MNLRNPNGRWYPCRDPHCMDCLEDFPEVAHEINERVRHWIDRQARHRPWVQRLLDDYAQRDEILPPVWNWTLWADVSRLARRGVDRLAWLLPPRRITFDEVMDEIFGAPGDDEPSIDGPMGPLTAQTISDWQDDQHLSDPAVRYIVEDVLWEAGALQYPPQLTDAPITGEALDAAVAWLRNKGVMVNHVPETDVLDEDGLRGVYLSWRTRPDGSPVEPRHLPEEPA